MFIWFVVIFVLAALANIFSGHLLAVVNNISVWWHVAGAAIVVLILIIVPDTHQSASFVFTERINNSGFSSGFYWFLVLPLGLLLTQYTITGFDASAHLSEETQGAAEGAAKGIWRSIFYSAVGGYILLLAFLFAVQDPEGVNEGFGAVDVIFGQALARRLALPDPADLHGRPALLHHGLPDQRLADDLRVQPRRRDPGLEVAVQGQPDDQDPGQRGDLRDGHRHHHHAARAQEHRRRPGRVLRGGLGRRDRPLPRVPDPDLPALADGRRLRAGLVDQRQEVQVDEPGRGRRDRHHLVYFILPFTPAGVPGNKDFAWSSVNYAPVLTFGTLIVLAIWWSVSAKNWFTGPKHTIDEAVLEAFDEG